MRTNVVPYYELILYILDKGILTYIIKLYIYIYLIFRDRIFIAIAPFDYWLSLRKETLSV